MDKITFADLEKWKEEKNQNKLIETLKYDKHDIRCGLRKRAVQALTILKHEPEDIDLKVLVHLIQGEFNKCEALGITAVNSLIKALRIKGYGSLYPTEKKLNDKEQFIQQESVKLLGKIGDKRAVDPLLVLLDNENETLRLLAIRSLQKIGDQKALDPIIKSLEDDYWGCRNDAAQALGDFGDNRAVIPLIKAMDDNEWLVRKDAAEALGKIGDSHATDVLIIALKDPDNRVQAVAAEALGKISDSETVPALIKLLKDRKAGEYAAKTLGIIGDSQVVEPLITVLKKKRKGQAAAWALGEIGDSRSVEPLIKMLKKDWSRNSAAKALGKISDTRATAPLKKILLEKNFYLMDNLLVIVEALNNTGDHMGLQAINSYLKAHETVNTGFRCGNCGKSVFDFTAQCPHCMVLLKGIQCKNCNFIGQKTDFVNKKCPKCGVSV